MDKYQKTFTNTAGDSISAAAITVYVAGTNQTVLATLFETNDTGGPQKPNPFLTATRGVISFYAADGKVDVRGLAISGLQYIDDNVTLFDAPPRFAALDAAVATTVQQAEIAGNAAVAATNAQAASQAASQAALFFRGNFASEAAALSNGVTSHAITANGGGGANGIGFVGTYSGGNGDGRFTFSVAAGAIVPSTVVITYPGTGYTTGSPPVPNYTASAGLTGVTQVVGIGQNVSPGEFFSVIVNGVFNEYQNVAGVSAPVTNYPSFELSGESVKAVCEKLAQQEQYVRVRTTAFCRLGAALDVGAEVIVVNAPTGTLTQAIVDAWFGLAADSHASFVVVKGNLVVPVGVTIRPPTRKLFMALYVSGNLQLDGSISMKDRGANHGALGSNIPAADIPIAVGTFGGVLNPKVPAIGGLGGAASTASGFGFFGGTAPTGGTGGGGSGRLVLDGTAGPTGPGAAGSAFSSGSGGGGYRGNGTAQAASPFGGKGGNANTGDSGMASGGAGNPAGTPGAPLGGGTAGTLILFVTGIFSGAGSINSDGSAGGTTAGGGTGGPSGGGSITLMIASNASTIVPSVKTGSSGNANYLTGNPGTGVGSARILPISVGIVGSTWYVSANGSAANPGTQALPWNLAHLTSGAGGVLGAGDTVQFLDSGGVYNNLSGVSFPASGTFESPVIYKAAPGHFPVIDGSYPEFRTAGNSAWQQAPEFNAGTGTHVYRSVNSFVGANVFAYGGKFFADGQWWSLARHNSVANLAQANQNYVSNAAYYIGYGITIGGANQFYIRLNPSSSAAMLGRTILQLGQLDPAQVPLYIYPGGIAGVTITGSNVVFGEGIEVNNYYNCVFLQGTNTKAYRSPMRAGYIGVRYGGTQNSVDECVIDCTMPIEKNWIAWNDVKGGALAADWNRAVTILPDSMVGHVTLNSTLKNAFDGIVGTIKQGSTKGNLFDNIWDDAHQIYFNCEDYEFAYNKCFGAGPSKDGSGGPSLKPGTIHVHHNVIDANKYRVFWGRAGRTDVTNVSPSGEFGAIALSTHGVPTSGKGFSWNFYHNTVIEHQTLPTDTTFVNAGIGQASDGGAPLLSPNGQHRVFNNIFMVRNQLTKEVSVQSGTEIWDGNMYFRVTGNLLFRLVYNSAFFQPTGANQSADTLAELTNATTVKETQAFYLPGWESQGIDGTNPALDVNYKPTAATAKYGAIDITDYGLPGASVYEMWRGAIKP